MTESEWNSCTDPRLMLECLRGKASQRKLFLLCAACCRRVWHLLESGSLRQSVDALERFADGELDETSFRAIAVATHPLRAYYDELLLGQVRDEKWLPAYGINRVMLGALVTQDQSVCSTLRPSIEDVERSLDFFVLATSTAGDSRLGGEERSALSAAECNAQAHLIRELFDDRFLATPVIDPAWLIWNDGIVHRLADSIYEDRCFPEGTLDVDRLAILADALEEAGCTNQDMLSHCRNGATHLRGCWVLDVLLDRI